MMVCKSEQVQCVPNALSLQPADLPPSAPLQSLQNRDARGQGVTIGRATSLSQRLGEQEERNQAVL